MDNIIIIMIFSIDGIWTGPPGEGQRAILQNAGIQQPPPYGQMPHIPRSGNIDFPDQPGPSAQDFADRAEVSVLKLNEKITLYKWMLEWQLSINYFNFL